MSKLNSVAGWVCIVFGSFTLGAVLAKNYDGWLISLFVLVSGWFALHNRASEHTEGEVTVAARRLRDVLGMHAIILSAWAVGLLLRLSEWGYLPTPALMNSALCLAIGLCILAAMELGYRRRWQWSMMIPLVAVTGTKFFYPTLFILPNQQSPAVGIGLIAALVTYVLLLVLQRWVP